MPATRLLAIPLLAMVFAACANTATAPAGTNNGVLGPGKWGSSDMGLVVTDSDATAHFDFCADGTIKTPIFLDPAGRFDSPGTYVRSIGPAIQARSARYIGLYRGTSLTVTVVLSDPLGPNGSDVVGPFDLVLNADGPPVRPCPIVY
jgi:hypothetical protein